MLVLGFEISTSCPACESQVPVNALIGTLYCPACARVLRLSPVGLVELLKAPFSSPDALRLNEGHRGEVWTQDGKFQLHYLRTELACPDCGAPAGADIASSAAESRSPCSRCGSVLSVREVPPPLVGGLTGVALVGEDLEQLAAAGETFLASSQSAPAVSCSQCNAALEVDGSDRKVICSYCRAPVIIPDDAWARLHPAVVVRRWFALIGGGHQPVAAPPQADVVWDGVDCVGADASGAVYCVGDGSVWAIDLERLTMRWMQHGHGVDSPDGLTVTREGEIVVWSAEVETAPVYGCRDGELRGHLGSLEPPGSEVHHLDFIGARAFTADADGTFVGLFHERLLRFERSGRGVPTWPKPTGLLSIFAARQAPRPLWMSCPERPEERASDWDPVRQRLPVTARQAQRFDWKEFDLSKMKDRPLAIGWDCDAHLHVGHDGHLYVAGRTDLKQSCLVKLDRQGKRVYAASLPLDELAHIGSSYAAAIVGAAVDGTAFVFGTQNDHVVIVRISPDGREITTLVKDHRLGGPLSKGDEQLAVTPDGRLVLVGRRGWIKVLAADGRVLTMSTAAQRKVDDWPFP